MIKLKIILKSNLFILILLLIVIIRICLIKNKSIYTLNNNHFECTIVSISKNNKYLLDCNELIEAKIDDDALKIGDILEIYGKLTEFNENTNFNLFNYKYYQNNKNIFYKLIVHNYKIIGKSNDLILNIKKYIVDRNHNLRSSSYLNAFILGDKSEIDTDSLKKLGIIHLFSVSGMHISFLLSFIDKRMKNYKIKKYLSISFISIYYLLIQSISILRCLIFLIVKRVNKLYDLKISKYKEIIISTLFLLILKPNAIYDLGFYYSVILYSGISLLNNRLKVKNKLYRNLITSLYVFLLSFPLTIYSSFEVNLLSIIYNLFFIPFVSIILFPLSIITFIFPFLDGLMLLLINIFELLTNSLKSINSCLIFMKPSVIVIVLYYIVIFLIIINRKILYLFLFILLIHYNYNFLFKSKYVMFFDVSQGDSALIHIDNTNILLDTGGNINNNIAVNITIPVLKSYGIRQIDYLIITHGDYDHMGEAINLVNNFKVEKVIFNCGEYNDLEKELIKVLDKKKIKYYSCIKELNIDNKILYFLQTKEYDNENDNSNVIYTELIGYKFIFMGDASVTTEKEILDKYNLPDIDVLKAGHHGSKTSSGKEFINEINPKYSIISVGKNNRYGHPNKEVLNNLNNSKIYRTDQDGSIMFKIKNNKLKIETCSP